MMPISARGRSRADGFETKPVNARAFQSKSGRNYPPIGEFHFCYGGFTLVEIMVVVVIIGIALSIAVSNLFVSNEERVRQEAERTLSLVEKTRDQAVFSGYPIAMRLTESGIEFLERDPNSVEPTWRAAASDTLRTRTWRDGVRVELSTTSGSGRAQTTTADNREQVVTFLPTGVGVPFSLRVFSGDDQRIIDGDALGNVGFRR